jgi:tRNA A37 threonylcarbamoyladenosine dehydratase
VEYENIFELSTLRKTYLIKTDSESICMQWIAAIKARQYEAIRESMGHAKVDKRIQEINDKAQVAFNQRVIEDNSMRLLEESNPILAYAKM